MAFISRTYYTGDGSQKDFSISWPYLEEDHVVVSLGEIGSEVVQVYGVDYTFNTASIIRFTTAPTAGVKVGIKRVTPAVLDTISAPSTILAAEINYTFTQLLFLAQEARDNAEQATVDLLRGLRIPQGQSLAELPTKASLPGKFITFDINGDPILTAGTGSDPTLRADLLSSTAGALIVSFTSSLAGSVARTLKAKLSELVYVTDFGFVGDGSAGDHAKLSAAITAARGKTLKFPEGNFTINTDNGTLTLEEVALEGEKVLDGSTASFDQGTNLLFTGTTNSPFKVRRGVSVEGFGFFWPNQVDSATPAVYPVAFDFDFTNGAVQFVNISRNAVYNAYKFVDMNGNSVGHVEIIGNYICALRRGIYVLYNPEHIRIQHNNFTFGFWLQATEAGAAGYQRGNSVAIEAAQSDGLEVVDNLFFGYLTGILAGGTGLCQFMNIALNKFDQVRYPVRATGAGNFNGTIVGNSFIAFNSQNTTLQGRSIEITTAGAAREYITIDGNNFLLATENHLFASGNGPTRTIVVGPQNWVSWAAYKAAGTYGAVDVSGSQTNLCLMGGWLEGGNAAARSLGVTGAPNTLSVIGATFDACQTPLSVSTNTATLTGNTSFGTLGTVSDSVSAGVIWQTGNKWDKPSGSSTKPFFVARKSASQTFNSGTATDASWGTESFDKGSNFATPIFTAPIAGRYRFTFSLMHDNTGTAGDRWQLLLVTGGGSFTQSYKMIADYNSVGFSAEVELAAGQTAKVQVQRVGGAGNFITFNDSNANYFTGSYIE